jgi:hypothetical protein
VAGVAAIEAVEARQAEAPHWSRQHGAWQDATDARRPAPGKEPLPAAVVIAIAKHHVHLSLALRGALEHDPGLHRRIDALRPHPRDAQGRNWNIADPAGGAAPPAGHEHALRGVVDALRDRFDLA